MFEEPEKASLDAHPCGELGLEEGAVGAPGCWEKGLRGQVPTDSAVRLEL